PSPPCGVFSPPTPRSRSGSSPNNSSADHHPPSDCAGGSGRFFGPPVKRGRRDPGTGVTLPMSPSGRFETTSGPGEGRLLGCAVLPAAPDDPCPCAGEDSYGVWVVAAAGDGLAVDLGR